jgi:hypothetical protein
MGVPGHHGYTTDPDHQKFYDETSLVAILAETGIAVKHVFHAPLRSIWLDMRMRQYFIHGVFQRA